MLKRRLVAEVDLVDDADSWRHNGDRHLGIVITDAGRAEIGAEVLKRPPPAQPANQARRTLLRSAPKGQNVLYLWPHRRRRKV